MNTAIEKPSYAQASEGRPAPSMVTPPSAAENSGRSPSSYAKASEDRAPASPHDIMERVVAHNDLSKLSAAERNTYYFKICERLGLEPATRPFEYIVLNGKLQLYARRDCGDQLRSKRNVSLEVVDQKIEGDLFKVHVRATTPDGRKDEDFGVVAIGQLRGEARANAEMKAITKAKRRVTLSICGLGMADESEIEDIPERDKLVLPPIAEPQRDVADPKPDRSRNIYQAMRAEIDALVDSGISPQEFWQWGKDNEPRVREMNGEWGNELRHYWMEKYKAVQEHWRELEEYKIKHEDSPQTIAEYLEK